MLKSEVIVTRQYGFGDVGDDVWLTNLEAFGLTKQACYVLL